MESFRLERLWRTRAGPWAMVVMNPVGFRLGYVRLPEELEDETRESIQDSLVDVHGGVTFGPATYPEDALDGGDGVPGGRWIGWDYAHFLDLPEGDAWRAATGRSFPLGEGEGEYRPHLWTTDEVALDCEHVATQVATAAVVAAMP